MKPANILFLLLFSTQALFAQQTTGQDYTALDKKALQLPDSLTQTTEGIAGYITTHFKTDQEKARAIFIWIATNIRYDMDNRFAINFYEKKEEKIVRPLKTRKGICENYAALFTDICQKAGIKSYVVEGYTKQNGLTDYIPHAWSAALIDQDWYLFDPTWGSGYVSAGKFQKKINNSYYKVTPSTLIRSHMPFDYLWQFLHYPVTNPEFQEGKTQQNKAKTYFSFTDSIQAYEQQNHIEQITASAYRVKKNGVNHSLIFDRLQHLKLELENDRKNTTVNLYNSAVVDYNEGINHYNDFINYRNKQFTPKKTDPEIQHMIGEAGNKLEEAQSKLRQITKPDVPMAHMIQQLAQSLTDADRQVKEQQDWLAQYLSKGKSGRKAMFYNQKITWFGIPLN